MYRNKDTAGGKLMSAENESFEYVLGTLRGDLRKEFERKMEHDAELQQEVLQWQERLNVLNKEIKPLPVPASVWTSIETKITSTAANEKTSNIKQEKRRIAKWLSKLSENIIPWSIAFAMTILFMVSINLTNTQPKTSHGDLPIDYVAVLLNESGQPKLTAMTSGEQKQLWLQWQLDELPVDANLQLWAKSKRDGQVRSVAVIESLELKKVDVSEAVWRLIKDADSLLLTVEEEGGSPLDEPSEQLIATGVCVRILAKQSG